MADSQYLLTFLIMLAVALMISDLTNRVKRQAESSRLREQRTSALYALSRELASNRGSSTLLQIAVKYIGEIFESQVVAFLPNKQGRLVSCANWPDPFPLTAKEQAVAQWVFDLGQVAGKGTDTLPGGSDTLFVPMMASGQPIGALGVRPKDPARLLIPDQLHLLEAFAHQTGLAIECDRLEEEGHQAQTQVETERLRNAILSSVPHDLRTPLAAITGSAATLLEKPDALSAATRRELIQNIYDEANRLGGVVNNMLDMIKLESGAVVLRKELVPAEEVIGSALTRLERRLAGRVVETRIPEQAPMAPMDSLLMEQVLMNLLDNALKYTPDDSPIEISVSSDADFLWITVADRGPGLPEGEPERLFEKFYRGGQHGREGFGLGLTICRAIVEAHGGKITAFNRPEGGAAFKFSLPLAEK